MTASRLAIGFSLLSGLLLAIRFHLEPVVFLLSVLGILVDVVWATKRSPARSMAAIIALLVVGTASVTAIAAMERVYRNDPDVIVVMITVIQMGDVLQYYIGTYLGETKITWISPRKMAEGYLFAGFSLPFVMLFLHKIGFPLPRLSVEEVVGFYVLGILSSLIYSLAKRCLRIKDWSPLLGSHGGFLDRADSLMLHSLYLWWAGC